MMERAQNDRLVATYIAQREALYRRAPFPLYGLPPSFEGPRAFGESAVTEEDGYETVEYLGLAHGSQRDDAPHLDVITATVEGAPDTLDALAAGVGVTLVPGSRPGAMTEALVESHGRVHRITRDLLVDGQPVEASGFEVDRYWVLQARVGDQVVTAAATSWPTEDLTLVRVPNLDSYIEGSRQLLRPG